jgi:hypothetical protein
MVVVSRMRLVAAPDLFHTAVISPNRHRPAARAAETAIVGVALVRAVTTLTPNQAGRGQPQHRRGLCTHLEQG